MAPTPPSRRYSLHYRLQTLEGATFIFWLFIIVLLFFPVLHFSLQGLLDQSIKSSQEQKDSEATTIARLLVLEFSHLQDLLTLKPEAPGKIDQELKRLLWEKVTFNEAIQGIELIQAQATGDGRHLTFQFYRRTAPELKPMDGPQQLLKSFSGLEREMIDLINREQRVDKGLQDAINRGPKREGEMLLRYLPLYVPVPEMGAIYWGVAKIGVDADSLRRLLLLQEEEQSSLWYKLSYRLFLCLIVSGVVILVFFNFWARRLTQPLHHLSRFTDALQTEPGPDVESLMVQLERLDHGGMSEVLSAREAMGRLAARLQHLAGRLGETLPRAALDRLGGRAAARLGPELRQVADDAGRRRLHRLLDNLDALLGAPDHPWREVNLHPLLQAAWELVEPQLPPSVNARVELAATPPVWGSPARLVQAVLLLLDYARERLPTAGDLLLQSQTHNGGTRLTVGFSGERYTPEAAARLLAAFPAPTGDPDGDGPALAAALFRQQGGNLTAAPRPGGGLVFQADLTAALPTGAGDAPPA